MQTTDDTDTHSDTTDTRLISAYVLRTELQVSMGSAAKGDGQRGGRPPDFKGKFFNIICPPCVLAAFVVKFLTL